MSASEFVGCWHFCNISLSFLIDRVTIKAFLYIVNQDFRDQSRLTKIIFCVDSLLNTII